VEEKRNLERKSPFYFLRVYDSCTRRMGGRIVNLSTEGMTLVCEEPIKEDTICKFRMILPETITDRRQMTLDARCIWCQEEDDALNFRSGFMFMDLSSKNLDTIKQLCQSP
jgi:hypothetical protein